jgi:hypothetical protein
MREDRSRQPLNPPEQAASAFAVTSLGSQVNSAHSAFADVALAAFIVGYWSAFKIRDQTSERARTLLSTCMKPVHSGRRGSQWSRWSKCEQAQSGLLYFLEIED